MLFRRRKKLGPWDKVRRFIWPQRSFSRSFQYFAKRILRLTATPHAIAAGVAAGVFASWTPLLGFHFVLAFIIAYCIAGNMVAAGLGTAIGNPLTFPFIWAATYKIGHGILDKPQAAGEISIDLQRLVHDIDLSQLWGPILKPMLVGALPPGIVSALLVYGVTYWSVGTFQARRRKLIAERAALSRAEPAGGAAALAAER